ncbi:MAG: CHAT domain-containing protein, partial [Planktothrix sp.]
RAESYAMGELGWLKQQQGNWTEAEQWTREAVAVTPPDAIDIRYQWEWQLGQILKEEGRTEAAIRHYTEAVDLLQQVRQNLVAIAAGMGEMNADLQFDFRDRVEPVYRELVGLLLQSELTVPNPSQANIKKARDVILKLQKAEISNFVLCDFYDQEELISIENFVKLNNHSAQNVAIIYPILFKDAIGVILKMPDDDNLKYHQSYHQQNVVQLVKKLRTDIQAPARPIITLSRDLYDLIIKPLEDNENLKSKAHTLVFVLDSQLRNIPMAALYDGTQYLVQTYSIALSTGWQKDAESKRLQNVQLNPLISGLSEDPQFGRFEPLPHVKEEINHIRNHLQLSDNQIKLNQDFTREAIKNELSALYYNLVHMATHGQFSSNPQNTFLITAPSTNAGKNSVDNRLNVNELDEILRNRDLTGFNDIELLVLSACETAKGDTRAALGLAGVAIRAGAHSTIASLWNLADNSTSDFMDLFYKELANQKLNKAEILQKTQQQFLADSNNPNSKDPSKWAPYVLIGDWL